MYPVFTLRFVLGLFVPEVFFKVYDRVVGKASPPPPSPDPGPTRGNEDLDLEELVRVEAQLDRLLERRDEILWRIRKRETPRSRLVGPEDKDLPS